MVDEKDDHPNQEDDRSRPKKGGKNLVLIIAVVGLALAGGAVAYVQLFGGKAGAAGQKKEERGEMKAALISLDPFILNLAEQGRFLKLSLQLEMADASQQKLVSEKIPQLRDAIITLVSSKSVESVSSPEGKFQLKDEILLRANHAIGKNVTFKNLYYTEFVMQ